MIEASTTTNLLKIKDTINEAIEKKINRVRIYGSSGSAKTYSILLLILDYLLDSPHSNAMCLSYNYNQAKLTIKKDLINILRKCEIPHKTTSYHNEFTFNNGSKLWVVNPSDENFGKGLRGFDIIYADEIDRFKQTTIEQIMQRSTLFICSFNPVNGWHKNIPNTVDLQLTYEGNEYIAEEERNNLLNYEILRVNQDGTINHYYDNLYQVYTLGNWSVNLLQCFTNIKIENEFQNFNPQIYGLDFSNSGDNKGDPDAMVKIQVIGNDIYVKSCFETNAYDLPTLAKVIKTDNILNLPVIYDNANGRTGHYLGQQGIFVKPCSKVKSVIEQIRLLNAFTIHILMSDKLLIKEFENYQFTDNNCVDIKPGGDHLIDAMRYGLTQILPEMSNRAKTSIIF